MTPEGSARIDLDDVRVGAAYELAARRRAASRRRAEALAADSPRRHARAGVREPRHDPLDPRGGAAHRTHRRPRAGRRRDRRVQRGRAGARASSQRCLFLEVADPADLSAAAAQLEGIEHAVFIEVAGTRVRGVPEVVSPPGESAAGALPAVQPRARSARRRSPADRPIAAGTDHPHLTVTVQLDEDQRRAIAADL